MTPAAITERVRAICLALPEVTEKMSHGAESFFAGKQFAAVRAHGHHGQARPQLWCPAPPGVQAELLEDEPERFFAPPYVGGRGWVGIWLDDDPDWDEIDAIVRDAYRHVAPTRLAAQLD